MVEMDHIQSDWHKQYAGIRQGCPLSPYLFLIIMTAIFHEVHLDDNINVENYRVQNADFSEVLYADDTICTTTNEHAMNRLLKKIEQVSRDYGLKLNKKKCELIKFGGIAHVIFEDGTPVPVHHEAKYLGCLINDKGDPKSELTFKLTECMITLKRLDIFWKKKYMQ